MLKKELPRTFVNVVQLLKVNLVKELTQGQFCSAVHSYVCPCIAFPKCICQEKDLLAELEQYKNLTRELIYSGEYDNSDNFTVVIQPLFLDYNFPRLADGKIDFSYLAPDCFHLSRKGHGNETFFNLIN